MTVTSQERLDQVLPAAPYGDASTRYLCAGAHLDSVFARDVLKSVLRQPRRAVGPSNGVDVGLVIRHCVSAYRRRLLRNGALVLVVLVLVWALWTQRSSIALAMLVVAWGIVLLEGAFVRFEVLAARLSSRRPDPRLPVSPRLQARLADIEAAQAVNVTVYSGYGPFVGSGLDLGAWSFAVDLGKGKEVVGVRRTPKPLDLGALRGRVAAAALATGIDRVSVTDVLHVSGQHLGDVPIQPGGPLSRPLGYVDPAVVREYVDRPTPTCRHFQRIQVVAWGGEMVLSIFLRFTVVGGRLYAEATYTFMPPVTHLWHVVDHLTPVPTPLQALQLVARSLLNTVVAVFTAAPMLLLDGWRVGIREPLERWEERIAIRDGTTVNYGTLTTVRQRGASGAEFRHFQKLDREMYVKLLERSILDTVVAVMDECDIDTSDLVERKSTILNEGVLITGGTLQAGSLAVGRGAKIARRVKNAAAAAGKA